MVPVLEKSELSNLAEALTCLLRVSTGKELEHLTEQYPFLDELTVPITSERGSEIKHLQRVLLEFFANGNVFLWAVERLLLAHRYRDLAAYMITDATLGPPFLVLLNAASKKYKSKMSSEALGDQSYQTVDFISIMNGIRGLHLEEDLVMGIKEAVAKSNEIRTFTTRITCYGSTHFEDIEVVDMLKTVDRECPNDSKAAPISRRLLNQLVYFKNKIHQDVNTSKNKGFVFSSSLRAWNKIGESLRQLCYLAGANIEHSATNSPWIIPALRATIDSQTGALAVTQGIIQQQNTKIQQQKQVITSLVFRSFMEQIPPVETQKKSATSRWQGFWDKAVKAAEANKDGFQKHPLHGILTPQLKDRGRDMYGTLSFGIHNYSDGAFCVDATTFTALDSKILKPLTPAKTSVKEDGTIDWVAERKRYGVE